MTQSLPWIGIVASGAFGAMIGSFLNVCIYRLPRRVSIVFPPSACPSCRTRIKPYDNIPVLGWLWLRGRCRSCRSRIPIRYPVVEALTALVFVFMFLRYGPTWELLPALFLAGTMIVVTLIDYDERIIPDVISLPGIPLGILASLLTPLSLWSSLAGAVVGFVFFYAIAWIYFRATGVEGMGGGDIKLAAMLGAFLGVQGLLLTVLLASLGGTLVGLSLMVLGRGGRRMALPFGTFLAPAAVVVYVFGADFLAWYMRWI